MSHKTNPDYSSWLPGNRLLDLKRFEEWSVDEDESGRWSIYKDNVLVESGYPGVRYAKQRVSKLLDEQDGVKPKKKPQPSSPDEDYDALNIRKDLIYLFDIERGGYKDLKHGETLIIKSFAGKLSSLRERLRATKDSKYEITRSGGDVYVKCLPRNYKPVAARFKLVETRTKMLVKRPRALRTPTQRTPWDFDVETGFHFCHELSKAATRWEIRPTEDKIWLWLICRDGVEIAKSRTLNEAKRAVLQLK